jgi:hypothetical protein
MTLGNSLQWCTPGQGVIVPAGSVRYSVLQAQFTGKTVDEAGCGLPGAPRLVSLRVRVADAPTDGKPSPNPLTLPARSLLADSVDLTWGVGQAMFRATLDVVGGATCVALYCDWVDVFFTAAAGVNTGALVVAACAPGPVSEGTRIARRSVPFVLPIAGDVDIDAPEGATQVQLVIPSQAATGPLCFARNKLGTITSFVVSPISAPAQNSRIVLPGGCDRLRLNANPTGVALDCLAIFETPL